MYFANSFRSCFFEDPERSTGNGKPGALDSFESSFQDEDYLFKLKIQELYEMTDLI